MVTNEVNPSLLYQPSAAVQPRGGLFVVAELAKGLLFAVLAFFGIVALSFVTLLLGGGSEATPIVIAFSVWIGGSLYLFIWANRPFAGLSYGLALPIGPFVAYVILMLASGIRC